MGEGRDKEEHTGQGFLLQEPEESHPVGRVTIGEHKALLPPSLADLPKCEQGRALSVFPRLLLRLGEGNISLIPGCFTSLWKSWKRVMNAQVIIWPEVEDSGIGLLTGGEANEDLEEDGLRKVKR